MPDETNPNAKQPIFPVSELQADHPRSLGRPFRCINDDEYREAARLDGNGVDDDHPSTEPGTPVPVMRDNAVPERDLPALAEMHRKLGQEVEPMPAKAIGEIKPTRAKPVNSDGAPTEHHPEITTIEPAPPAKVTTTETTATAPNVTIEPAK